MDACLIRNTLVKTNRGDIKICDVTTEDQVMTREGWRKVTWSGKTFNNVPTLELLLSNGTTLQGTAEHPIYVETKGFTPLGVLTYGDILCHYNNSDYNHTPITVVSICNKEEADVYNLHVDEVHEFYANGILVHNCVWALTELMTENQFDGFIQYYQSFLPKN